MWSSGFISMLARQSTRLQYILRVVDVGTAPGVVGYVAASMSLHGDPVIGERGVSVSGPGLNPRGYSSTLGTCTVALAGDLSGLLRAVTRGTYIEIRAGDVLDPDTAYEVIFIGQVEQITREGRVRGTLTARDLLSALRCRPTTTASDLALYADYSATDTLTTAYAIGDGSLVVASTTGFEKPTGISGGLRVDNGTDDPFILRWSSATATTFTITGTSDNSHGTVRVAAPIGATVDSLFFIEAHPIDAARYILTSTGNGTNGVYDILPDTWAFGLPDSFIDHRDCGDYRTESLPAMVAEFMLDARQYDPLGWLQGCLSRLGFYLTCRMGLITVRAGLMSTRASTGTSAVAISAGRDLMLLTDADITSAQCDLWDGDTSEEYASLAVISSAASGATWVTASSTTGEENPATLPALPGMVVDISDLVFTGATATREHIVGRCWETAQRIPERYTLTLAGLRAAVLAPGDFIRASCNRVAGRITSTIDGLNDCRMVVTQVETDYAGGTVTLTALVYPTSEAVFP